MCANTSGFCVCVCVVWDIESKSSCLPGKFFNDGAIFPVLREHSSQELKTQIPTEVRKGCKWMERHGRKNSLCGGTDAHLNSLVCRT